MIDIKETWAELDPEGKGNLRLQELDPTGFEYLRKYHAAYMRKEKEKEKDSGNTLPVKKRRLLRHRDLSKKDSSLGR